MNDRSAMGHGRAAPTPMAAMVAPDAGAGDTSAGTVAVGQNDSCPAPDVPAAPVDGR